MVYLYNYLAVIIYGIWIMAIKVEEKTKRRVFFLCSTLHITLFHALRDPYIYPDNELYERGFLRAADMSLWEVVTDLGFVSTGIGFNIQNFFLSKLSSNPSIMFVFTSIVMIVGISWLFYKISANPFLSILIYLAYPLLFYHTLYVLRQGMATIFILYSLYFIGNKNALSVVFALIGATFHPTAIIFLPFILFNKLKLWKYPLATLVIFILFVALLFRLSLNMVLSHLPRYEDYGNGESVNNIMPFVVLSILSMLQILNHTERKVQGIDKTIINYLFYGTAVSIFTIGLPGGGRLCSYFIYIIPFAFPMLSKYKAKNRSITCLGIMYIIILVLVSYHVSEGRMYDVYKIAINWHDF